MSDKPEVLGYWLPVYDEHSAAFAVRMAAAPIFLMGMGLTILAYIGLWHACLAYFRMLPAAPDFMAPACNTALAVPLLALGLRIRSGHAAWLPLVLVMFLPFLIANLFAGYAVWQSDMNMMAISQVVFICLVPLCCAALVFSGLRGWLWLKRHKVRMSF